MAIPTLLGVVTIQAPTYTGGQTISHDFGATPVKGAVAFCFTSGQSSGVHVGSISIGGVALTMADSYSLAAHGDSGRLRSAYTTGLNLTGSQNIVYVNNEVAGGAPNNNSIPRIVIAYFDEAVSITAGSAIAVLSSTISGSIASNANSRAVMLGRFDRSGGITIAGLGATVVNSAVTDAVYGDVRFFALSETGAAPTSVVEASTGSATGGIVYGYAFNVEGSGGATAPAIGTSPSNQTVTEPAAATFTATATGSTSLQWQVSSNGGSTWSSVAGGTGATSGTTSGSYTTGATAVASGSHRNGYQYRCAFTNATGTTYSAAATLTVNAAGDTTAPTLTSPVGTATSPTTATVGATTNEANGTMYGVVTTIATTPTVAQVKAGQNSNGTSGSWSGNQVISAVGAKTFSVSPLAASTAYSAFIVHADAAGNNSPVSSVTFSTPAAGDATAPGSPGTPTASATTKTSYTISYTAATDNVAVTGYESRFNGTGTVTDRGNVLTFGVTGRTPGTTDTIDVRAYDAAGNRGAWATSASIVLPIYGFDFHTATGLEFGLRAGSTINSIGLHASANIHISIFAVASSLAAPLAVAGPLATGAGGRLARYTNALLNSATYRIVAIDPASGKGATFTMAAT